MKDYNKNIYVSFILMLIFIFYGSFLILEPNSAISLVSKLLAAMIFILSINAFIRYFIREDKLKRLNYNLIYGILTAIVAAFLFFKDSAIGVIIPPAFGIFMLINTSLRAVSLSNLIKERNPLWKVVFMIMFVEYLLAFAVVFNVFGEVLKLTQIVGISGIFYTVLDFILVYLLSIISTKNEAVLIEGKVR